MHDNALRNFFLEFSNGEYLRGALIQKDENTDDEMFLNALRRALKTDNPDYPLFHVPKGFRIYNGQSELNYVNISRLIGIDCW